MKLHLAVHIPQQAFINTAYGKRTDIATQLVIVQPDRNRHGNRKWLRVLAQRFIFPYNIRKDQIFLACFGQHKLGYRTGKKRSFFHLDV